MISDKKDLIVDKYWKLAIDGRDRQRMLVAAPVGPPSVCNLPSSPSLKIYLQTQDVVNGILFYTPLLDL